MVFAGSRTSARRQVMNPSKTGRRSLKSGLFEPKFWPPSAERNRPAPAATSKMPGAGATIRLIICPAKTVSSIPPSTIAQLCPPSVERNTPTPLLNARPPSYGFPLPAYTIFGLAGSTATAPIESEGIESMVGIQFEPPSEVFQIPPSFVALYRLVSAVPLGSMAISVTSPESGPSPGYTLSGVVEPSGLVHLTWESIYKGAGPIDFHRMLASDRKSTRLNSSHRCI